MMGCPVVQVHTPSSILHQCLSEERIYDRPKVLDTESHVTLGRFYRQLFTGKAWAGRRKLGEDVVPTWRTSVIDLSATGRGSQRELQTQLSPALVSTKISKISKELCSVHKQYNQFPFTEAQRGSFCRILLLSSIVEILNNHPRATRVSRKPQQQFLKDLFYVEVCACVCVCVPYMCVQVPIEAKGTDPLKLEL